LHAEVWDGHGEVPFGEWSKWYTTAHVQRILREVQKPMGIVEGLLQERDDETPSGNVQALLQRAENRKSLKAVAKRTDKAGAAKSKPLKQYPTAEAWSKLYPTSDELLQELQKPSGSSSDKETGLPLDSGQQPNMLFRGRTVKRIIFDDDSWYNPNNGWVCPPSMSWDCKPTSRELGWRLHSNCDANASEKQELADTRAMVRARAKVQGEHARKEMREENAAARTFITETQNKLGEMHAELRTHPLQREDAEASSPTRRAVEKWREMRRSELDDDSEEDESTKWHRKHWWPFQT
jgi:hypothetical protein